MKKAVLLISSLLLLACASTHKVDVIETRIDSLEIHIQESDSLQKGADTYLYQMIMQIYQNQQVILQEVERMKI